MPIHVILRSGRDVLIEGETRKDWELLVINGRHGELTTKDPVDGLETILLRNEVAWIKPIPKDKWEERKAEEKAAEDAKKKEREDAKAMLKTDADYHAAARAMEAAEKRAERAEAAFVLLEGRTFRGRIRRAWAWVKRGGRKAQAAAAVLVLVLVLAGCHTPGEVFNPMKDVPSSKWYELRIGQVMNISEFAMVYRVPGGWVFRSKGGYGESAAFIPYSEEGK